MLPYSLSYVMANTDKTQISKQGVIIQISAKQWMPLDAEKDRSILLDASDQYILLYCPVGETFLRSRSRKKPSLLQIS